MASTQRLAQLSAAKQLDLSSDFVPIYSVSQPTHYAGHSTGRCSMIARGALLLSPKDNVATMLEDAPPGREVPVRLDKEVRLVKALEKVPFGFKIAVLDIAQGAGIVKEFSGIPEAGRFGGHPQPCAGDTGRVAGSQNMRIRRGDQHHTDRGHRQRPHQP
jgi:hypothetical protein